MSSGWLTRFLGTSGGFAAGAGLLVRAPLFISIAHL
jgi:hypothetical protein